MQLITPTTTDTGRKLNAIVEQFRLEKHPSPLFAAVATPEGRALYNKFRAEQDVAETTMKRMVSVFRGSHDPSADSIFRMAKEKPEAYAEARRAGLV